MHANQGVGEQRNLSTELATSFAHGSQDCKFLASGRWELRVGLSNAVCGWLHCPLYTLTPLGAVCKCVHSIFKPCKSSFAEPDECMKGCADCILFWGLSTNAPAPQAQIMMCAAAPKPRSGDCATVNRSLVLSRGRGALPRSGLSSRRRQSARAGGDHGAAEPAGRELSDLLGARGFHCTEWCVCIAPAQQRPWHVLLWTRVS